jgi:hypothetical protein
MEAPMTVTDKSLLSRIKKLLALTVERGATPEEAATAAAKAQEILFEHNLTMSQVEAATEGSSTEGITQTTVTFTASNKRSLRWRRRLHSYIADHYFCDTVYFSSRPSTIVFIGKPSNVEVCVYMAQMIGDQIHKLGLKEYNAANANGSNPTSTYTAYCLGAVMTVNERMAAQTRKQAATGNALMVVNTKQLAEAMAKFFPKLGKTRRTRIADGAAFQRGRKDGHSVRLTQGIGNTSAPRKAVQS